MKLKLIYFGRQVSKAYVKEIKTDFFIKAATKLLSNVLKKGASYLEPMRILCMHEGRLPFQFILNKVKAEKIEAQ